MVKYGEGDEIENVKQLMADLSGRSHLANHQSESRRIIDQGSARAEESVGPAADHMTVRFVEPQKCFHPACSCPILKGCR